MYSTVTEYLRKADNPNSLAYVESLHVTQNVAKQWSDVNFYHMGLWSIFTRTSRCTLKKYISVVDQSVSSNFSLSFMSVRRTLLSSILREAILMDLVSDTCFRKQYTCLVLFEFDTFCISSVRCDHHIACIVRRARWTAAFASLHSLHNLLCCSLDRLFATSNFASDSFLQWYPW